jgi:hypothetical protein
MLKRCFPILCFLLAAMCHSQSKFELGLHGSNHISAYRGNIGSKEPFTFQGYSVGLRIARDLKKDNLQAGILFTRMDLGYVAVEGNSPGPASPIHLQTECLEIQTLYRHRFNDYKKVVPYIAGGLSNFLWTREVNYNSQVDPHWFANTNEIGHSRYNIALIATVGVKCRFDQNFSIDMEPNFKYFVFRNTNYRHNISVGLALTCCYRFKSKQQAIPD